MKKSFLLKIIVLVIIIIIELVLVILIFKVNRQKNNLLYAATINKIIRDRKSFTESDLDFARRLKNNEKLKLFFTSEDKFVLKRDPFSEQRKRVSIIKRPVFKLEGIACDKEIQIAIINGKILTKGSIIEGFVVFEINPSFVRLSNGTEDLQIKF